MEMCRQALESGGVSDLGFISGQEPLPEQLPGNVCFMGDLSVQRWAAVLGQARLLVSLDTGAVHIGACMGIPVVSVHMPVKSWYSMQAFYPWGVEHSVIEKGEATPTIERIANESQRLWEQAAQR